MRMVAVVVIVPPDSGFGMQTVTVDGVKNATNVDFGWDYQFAP